MKDFNKVQFAIQLLEESNTDYLVVGEKDDQQYVFGSRARHIPANLILRNAIDGIVDQMKRSGKPVEFAAVVLGESVGSVLKEYYGVNFAVVGGKIGGHDENCMPKN